ncbi:MAG: hypothetical protein ABSG21_14945, partial [Spirochaetia bacterium]
NYTFKPKFPGCLAILASHVDLPISSPHLTASKPRVKDGASQRQVRKGSDIDSFDIVASGRADLDEIAKDETGEAFFDDLGTGVAMSSCSSHLDQPAFLAGPW